MWETIKMFDVFMIVLGLIISSGGLVFFLRYGIRLALVENTLKENSLPNLAARLIVLESNLSAMKSDVAEVKQGMTKLNQLDSLHVKMDSLAELLGVKFNTLPCQQGQDNQGTDKCPSS